MAKRFKRVQSLTCRFVLRTACFAWQPFAKVSHSSDKGMDGTFRYVNVLLRLKPWILLVGKVYTTLKYSQPPPKFTVVKIDPIQPPQKINMSEKGPC